MAPAAASVSSLASAASSRARRAAAAATIEETMARLPALEPFLVNNHYNSNTDTDDDDYNSECDDPRILLLVQLPQGQDLGFELAPGGPETYNHVVVVGRSNSLERDEDRFRDPSSSDSHYKRHLAKQQRQESDNNKYALPPTPSRPLVASDWLVHINGLPVQGQSVHFCHGALLVAPARGIRTVLVARRAVAFRPDHPHLAICSSISNNNDAVDAEHMHQTRHTTTNTSTTLNDSIVSRSDNLRDSLNESYCSVGSWGEVQAAGGGPKLSSTRHNHGSSLMNLASYPLTAEDIAAIVSGEQLPRLPQDQFPVVTPTAKTEHWQKGDSQTSGTRKKKEPTQHSGKQEGANLASVSSSSLRSIHIPHTKSNLTSNTENSISKKGNRPIVALETGARDPHKFQQLRHDRLQRQRRAAVTPTPTEPTAAPTTPTHSIMPLDEAADAAHTAAAPALPPYGTPVVPESPTSTLTQPTIGPTTTTSAPTMSNVRFQPVPPAPLSLSRLEPRNQDSSRILAAATAAVGQQVRMPITVSPVARRSQSNPRGRMTVGMLPYEGPVDYDSRYDGRLQHSHYPADDFVGPCRTVSRGRAGATAFSPQPVTPSRPAPARSGSNRRSGGRKPMDAATAKAEHIVAQARGKQFERYSSTAATTKKAPKEAKATHLPIDYELPHPGKVCRHQRYYCTLVDETLKTVADKLGSDWTVLARLPINAKTMPTPLQRNTPLAPYTLVAIPPRPHRDSKKLAALAMSSHDDSFSMAYPAKNEQCASPAVGLLSDGCFGLAMGSSVLCFELSTLCGDSAAHEDEDEEDRTMSPSIKSNARRGNNSRRPSRRRGGRNEDSFVSVTSSLS